MRPVDFRTRAGLLRKGGSELRWIRGCERHRRGGWVRCRGEIAGPTGVSTRCARPPHALRPCRVTRRPSLRSESNYGLAAPAGRRVPPSTVTPDVRPSSRRVGWGVRGHVAQWRPQTRGLLGCGGLELRPFPTHTCFRRPESTRCDWWPAPTHGNRTREAVDTMMADTVEPPVLQPVDPYSIAGCTRRAAFASSCSQRRSKGVPSSATRSGASSASSPTRLSGLHARNADTAPALSAPAHRHVQCIAPCHRISWCRIELIRSSHRAPALPAVPACPWNPSESMFLHEKTPVRSSPRQPPLHLALQCEASKVSVRASGIDAGGVAVHRPLDQPAAAVQIRLPRSGCRFARRVTAPGRRRQHSRVRYRH